MSLSWPPKDPQESLEYSIDWSRFLEGSTITEVNWFVVTSAGVKTSFPVSATVEGLTNAGESFTGTVCTIRLSNGTLNSRYKIVAQITFGTSSLIAERTVTMSVRNR